MIQKEEHCFKKASALPRLAIVVLVNFNTLSDTTPIHTSSKESSHRVVDQPRGF